MVELGGPGKVWSAKWVHFPCGIIGSFSDTLCYYRKTPRWSDYVKKNVATGALDMGRYSLSLPLRKVQSAEKPAGGILAIFHRKEYSRFR